MIHSPVGIMPLWGEGSKWVGGLWGEVLAPRGKENRGLVVDGVLAREGCLVSKGTVKACGEIRLKLCDRAGHAQPCPTQIPRS